MVNLNKQIVIDIDGVLADNTELQGILDKRNYKLFFDSVQKSSPVSEMFKFVSLLYSDHHITFLTGRSEVCREATLNWLNKHFSEYNIVFDHSDLIMRKQDDYSKSHIYKANALQENDITPLNTLFIIDDCKKSIETFGELGFNTLDYSYKR